LATLQQSHDTAMHRQILDSPLHLLLAGELGITMAWRLADLPSCERLAVGSVSAVNDWVRTDGDAIAGAIAGARQARLVLASLIRTQQLIDRTTKKRFKKSAKQLGAELALWVAAMTLPSGGTAFGVARGKDLRDGRSDLGLLARAAGFDPEWVQGAIDASLGSHPDTGRLAWEVSLPETMHHDEQAGLAILLPDWDVRRGRTHIDYGGKDVSVEIYGGREKLLGGSWQTMIEVGGDEQQPRGDWVTTCEYTDDEVHYLELEQPWTGGVVLQRQFFLIRDDRILLLADGVVPDSTLGDQDRVGSIRYGCRLPIADGIESVEEAETRELFLAGKRNRCLCVPLAANEWKVGASTATLGCSHDRHLTYETKGYDRLYAPLWFDFQQKRFRRQRTWRKLTVGDQLRIVRDDEAVGYRVQIGAEQWMLYRSLGDRCCRSVLGKHLLADFLAGRFDPNDGTIDELITVDISESFDD
jgi:hypothetical protein